jgi:hypothetical protein
MNKVYENKSQQWFDSWKFAGEYYGIPASKIRDNLNIPMKVKGIEVIFSEDPLPPPDKFRTFVQIKGLKHMIQNFYINKEMEVWLWSKNKEEWYKWNTIKFDNGNISFKTKIQYQGMYVDKWVNVNQFYKGIFGEIKEMV